MGKNNYTYSKEGANLSVIKIQSFHCWCCGEQFQKNVVEKQKTDHHAIPEELKPVRNITVPVCDRCSKNIHQDSQAMNPKKIKVLKKLERMKKHYKGVDETIDSIIEDLTGKKSEEEPKDKKENKKK